MLSFLVAHPAFLVVGASAVGAAAWYKSRRVGKQVADELQAALWCAQAELHEVRQHNQPLIAQQERFQKQLAYWLAPGNCLAEGWAIINLTKVRKRCWYAQDESLKSQKHLGTKDAIFEPAAPPPPKLPTTEADYAPALVLTKCTGAGKFKIVVCWLAEMDKFPQEPLAEVDVEPVADGWSFDIPRSVRGTGALSAAFDYLLARAEKEQVPILGAPLTHVDTEAHRRRLRRFYVEKYGFTYLPSSTNPNGYISKRIWHSPPEKAPAG